MQQSRGRGWLITAGSILFWVVLWQLASMAIAQELFLPSPLAVIRALGGLVGTGLFWQSVGNSLLRISAGFLLGLVLGCALAVLAAASRVAEVLLRPLMLLARATPVSSFIILALIWFSSKNISVFVSFWMVLPVLYGNTLSGIQAADKGLLEMARVFRVSGWRQLRAVYLPALRGPLLAAVELAYGMCWKSGVAAEVIGLPRATVGERMYQAKLYFQIPDMFAWTAVVIALSWAVGRLAVWLVRTGCARLEGGRIRPQRAVQPPEAPAALALREVTKQYGAQTVLQDFTLTLAPGGRLALRGESGIGKTTLARLVLGLEKPDAGHIDAPGRKAAVFQEDRLCGGLSAIGNVALVLARPDEAAIRELLAGVGLGPGDVEKPAGELSGGQRRRVALVRALAANSGLVVLDEAFKGLDDLARARAYAFTLSQLRGRTLLVVTHDGQEAKALCGQSLVL